MLASHTTPIQDPPHTSQKVVHIKRDSYDLYIGRGSMWGNPYRIGPDGSRAEVLAKYKEHLLRGEGRHLLERIVDLDGKTLGCFCACPGGLTAQDRTHCHGQLLLRLVELWIERKQLRKEKS